MNKLENNSPEQSNIVPADLTVEQPDELTVEQVEILTFLQNLKQLLLGYIAKFLPCIDKNKTECAEDIFQNVCLNYTSLFFDNSKGTKIVLNYEEWYRWSDDRKLAHLKTIAKRRTFDFARKYCSNQNSLEHAPDDVDSDKFIDENYSPQCSQSIYENDKINDLVELLTKGLKDDETLLFDFLSEGLSYGEIAIRLNITETTLRKRIERLRGKLKLILSKNQ